MADVDFDEFEDSYAAPPTGRMGRFVHLAGAACSVALILGMAYWGYKLAVRDVSGIPVVRALSGPMRIAPENPGGAVAMHQGLSVNAVAAAGTVSPLPEKVLLAPQELDLADEDLPGLAASDQNAAGPEAVASTAPPELDAAVAPLTASAPIAAAAVASGAANAVETTAVAEMTAPLAIEPATEEDAVAAALASALSADPVAGSDLPPGIGANIVSSPRPPARPAEFAALAPLADDQATLVAAVEVDPATIAEGTRLVQLGAFDDEPAARTEWAKIQGRFPEVFADKSLVIQSAQSGGRTFYRLRALGFKDEEAARSFCATLLADNISCIPVAQR